MPLSPCFQWLAVGVCWGPASASVNAIITALAAWTATRFTISLIVHIYAGFCCVYLPLCGVTLPIFRLLLLTPCNVSILKYYNTDVVNGYTLLFACVQVHI